MPEGGRFGVFKRWVSFSIKLFVRLKDGQRKKMPEKVPLRGSGGHYMRSSFGPVLKTGYDMGLFSRRRMGFTTEGMFGGPTAKFPPPCVAGIRRDAVEDLRLLQSPLADATGDSPGSRLGKVLFS